MSLPREKIRVRRPDTLPPVFLSSESYWPLERDIMRSREAQALQDAIVRAVSAYADYLERSDLVLNEADNAIGWRDDRPKSLVVRWSLIKAW